MKHMAQLKTVVLLATLTALFGGVGHFLGGQNGLVMGLLFAGLINFGAYWFSDKIVLKMHGARPITAQEAPELWDMIQNLASQMGLPMPAVYRIAQNAPNAFATGRNPSHAAVAVTDGLLALLDKRELRGVLAHELGHIQNRDTLISTIAATLAGALSLLAEMTLWRSIFGGGSDRGENHNPIVGIIGMILAPLAGLLIQSAISRSREFMADHSGAEVSGDPLALASALMKIESASRRIPLMAATPATASLYIINPFRGEGTMKLFSTHPPTRERVQRLEKMANDRIGIHI